MILILILLIISKSHAEIIKTTCKSILNDREIGVRSFILNTDLKINEQKDDGFKIIVGVIKKNNIIKWNYFEYAAFYAQEFDTRSLLNGSRYELLEIKHFTTTHLKIHCRRIE